jgi:hypothetical protein
MDATAYYETLVAVYLTSRRNITEDRYANIHCRQNPES